MPPPIDRVDDDKPAPYLHHLVAELVDAVGPGRFFTIGRFGPREYFAVSHGAGSLGQTMEQAIAEQLTALAALDQPTTTTKGAS